MEGVVGEEGLRLSVGSSLLCWGGGGWVGMWWWLYYGKMMGLFNKQVNENRWYSALEYLEQ